MSNSFNPNYFRCRTDGKCGGEDWRCNSRCIGRIEQYVKSKHLNQFLTALTPFILGTTDGDTEELPAFHVSTRELAFSWTQFQMGLSIIELKVCQ